MCLANVCRSRVTEGLLTDSTMFEAFLAREGENHDNDNDTIGAR